MTHEEESLRKLRHERIARTKRILRWMPRRANIHRYPGLRWFAKSSLRRMHLWSFRTQNAIPAIYAGSVIAFWPLYGIQLPIAVLFALILKANLPILVSLQFISNPVTIIPVYLVAYQVGRLFLSLVGIDCPALNGAEIQRVLQSLMSGDWILQFRYFGQVWLVMALGGTILGSFIGSVSSAIYRFMTYEINLSYKRLKQLQAARKEASSKKENA